MISEGIYLHYFNSLLEGNKRECSQIVTNLIEQNICPKDIFIELFQRSMYRIGQMWEHEKCSIADEHVASNITAGLIELVVLKFSAIPRNGKSAVITCIDKEFHELGAHIVAGYLEVHGWSVIFAGSNIPQKDLLGLIKEKNPNLIGISNNFYINFVNLTRLIKELNIQFPDKRIIIGGQALACGIAEGFKDYKNVTYINSLDHLEEFIYGFQTNY